MKWNVLVNPACQLGEGVSWSEARQAVVFVDIHGKKVLAYELPTGKLRTWHAPQRIGWLIPRQGRSDFIAGLQEGFATLSLDEDGDALTPTWVARPFEGPAEARKGLRLNDAKADAAGRVWAGSLNNDDESQPLGALFRLDPDGSVRKADDGYNVANGPAISQDGRTLLHTDSARRTIHAFDLDADAGTLSGKRVWRVFEEDEGYPDGMNFDADGRLWVAHWGAGCISQFDMAGQLLQRLKLPVSNVTNLAFGGPGLDRLFVTTAWQGLNPSQREQEPLAGALFEITDHGSRGIAPHPYGG